MLISGELQEGLAFDEAYRKYNGIPLTHLVIPEFAAQDRHEAIFLTKSVMVRNLLELEPTSQIVLSWSINAEDVGRKWERGAPLPSKRIDAALRMKDLGWRIRIRLDPMVPYDGWEAGYGHAIDMINRLEPELLTIGALRATNARMLQTAAKKNGRDASILGYLTREKDPSGFKYRIEHGIQREMFDFVKQNLKLSVQKAFCKEDISLWNALDMGFTGCNCLLGSKDSLITPESPVYSVKNHPHTSVNPRRDVRVTV